MPEPKRSPAENLPWVPLATAVAGVLAGSWLLFQPLTSSRPTVASPQGKKGKSIQDVDARLWQDPLQPLAAAAAAPQIATFSGRESESAYDKQTHSIDELLDEFYGDGSKKRLILAIMVNGDGYAEKIERRLRDRVAVENALERAGYSPKDAQHLGYFTLPWPRFGDDPLAWAWFKPSEDRTSALSDCQRNPDCTVLTVPFEEHEPDPVIFTTRQWGKILVLWLRQDFFDDNPLTRLAQLLSLFPKTDATPCDV